MMNTDWARNFNVEFGYLDKMVEKKEPVVVYTTNGFQQHGIITAHDDAVIQFVDTNDGRERIVFKSAISTIAPETK